MHNTFWFTHSALNYTEFCAQQKYVRPAGGNSNPHSVISTGICTTSSSRARPGKNSLFVLTDVGLTRIQRLQWWTSSLKTLRWMSCCGLETFLIWAVDRNILQRREKRCRCPDSTDVFALNIHYHDDMAAFNRWCSVEHN